MSLPYLRIKMKCPRCGMETYVRQRDNLIPAFKKEWAATWENHVAANAGCGFADMPDAPTVSVTTD